MFILRLTIPNIFDLPNQPPRAEVTHSVTPALALVLRLLGTVRPDKLLICLLLIIAPATRQRVFQQKKKNQALPCTSLTR